MDLITIAGEIADEIQITPPATLASTATLTQEERRLKSQINLAYNVILLALNRTNEYRETETTLSTSAGTEAYNIPTGLLTVDQLKIGTDPPMRIIPWPEYERYKADTFLITVTGYPDVTSIFQRKIHFYPIPDAVYSVKVRGQENMTELDDDTDSPDLAADFHRAVREFALYYAMEFENNPRAGNLSLAKNGELVAQGGQAARAVDFLNMVKNNSRNHYEEPPRMIGSHEIRRLTTLRRIVRA